ncbi:hypothetical protein QAD02_006166 [Eretmocerus hayati]|uniref:Uncharacterized protein n=1 Tax=Eretmocerus hayati TaxID=131215 RepID=A0ACC2N2I3_9HYME|nr:hypothetical protein QAD02_006166 [Eretmocerus hayati]
MSFIQICMIILYVSHTQAGNPVPEFHSITKTWSAKHFTIFTFDHNLIQPDGTFLHSPCTIFENGGRKKYECRVTLEEPFQTSNVSSARRDICNVTLEADPERRFIDDPRDISLRRFGDHKALLIWEEIPATASDTDIFTKCVMILDMVDCSTKQLEFSYEYQSNKGPMQEVIVYIDTFDVIDSYGKCDQKPCRISYNNEGKQVGNPVYFGTVLKDPIISPASSISSVEGFFLLGDVENEGPEVAQLSHVNEDGIETRLVRSDSNVKSSKYSHLHGALGLCWTFRNETVYCAKYDSSTELRLNTTFKLEKDSHILAVFNLPNDGILLLTARIMIRKVSFDESHTVEGENVTVLKVNTDGRLELLYEMPNFGLKCNHGKMYQLVTNYWENGKLFCFDFACSYSHETIADSMLTLSRRCARKI